MKKVNDYPRYVYHREYDEPRRVDNREQENELVNKGWSKSYLYKEFPKYVNGIIVKTPEEEKLLLSAKPGKTLKKDEPKVVVKKTVLPVES